MSEHNLDDLIIDDIKPKNNFTKNILTFAALGLIVLVVAIVLTKIILKDPAQIALQEENVSAYIDPSLTLDNEIIPPKKTPNQTLALEQKQEPALPKPPQIEKTQEHSDTSLVAKTTRPLSTTQPPKTLKQSPAPETDKHPQATNKTTDHTPAQTANKPQTPVQKSSTPNKQPKIKKVEITDEFAQIPSKNTSKKPPVASTPRPKHTQTASTPKVAPKPQQSTRISPSKQTPSQKANTPSQKGDYFVQVGSFTQTPGQRFLSVIKKSGYNYKITPPNEKGLKKLLIGPFANKQAALQALPRIRDRINKGAFILYP